jgi:hypothetical protein
LIEHFVGFINSSRGSRHKQYRLADKVLRRDESVPAIKAAIRKQARGATKNWFDADDEYLYEEGVKRVKKSVANAMSRMKTYFEDYDKVARAAVTKYVEGMRSARAILDARVSRARAGMALVRPDVSGPPGTDSVRRFTCALCVQEDALDRQVVCRVRLDGKSGGLGDPAHERVERHRPRSVVSPGRVPLRRASASARSARRSAAGDASGPA